MINPVQPPLPATEVDFFVPGEPTSQGSMKAFTNKRTGKSQLVHSNPALKAWRRTVAQAADYLVREVFYGGVTVELEFRMPRPKSVKRAHPITRSSYDLDKLIRAVFDALTDSGVIEDDSRVVEVRARKVYAETLRDVGVQVHITAVPGS
jgi:Holliday junction resolvase RusA-like endonuclease